MQTVIIIAFSAIPAKVAPVIRNNYQHYIETLTGIILPSSLHSHLCQFFLLPLGHALHCLLFCVPDPAH